MRLGQFVTVVLVTLLDGLAFAHLLERPAKMQYSGDLHVTLQRTLYVQWGFPNFGGILEPAAVVSTCVLVFLVRRQRRRLWFTLFAAVALVLAFPVVFSGVSLRPTRRFVVRLAICCPPTGRTCATGRNLATRCALACSS